jgi:hypothetical protein
MEPEAPVRLPGRCADDRRVLFDYRGRGRAGEEVEVEGAAEDAVLNERDSRVGGGEKEDVGAGGAGLS